MWNLHNAVKLLNLIEGIDGGRKSTVQAEDVALNDGSEREVVEKTCEVLPDIGVSVLTQALVVESINLCDLL